MILAGLFLLFFIGGPLMFRAATQHGPSKSGLRVLGWTTVAFAVAGLGTRYGFPQRWGQDALLTSSGILLIWFAWIGALAYATQTLRRSDRGLRMQRWTGVLGALGTTMPWFGLASANMFGA